MTTPISATRHLLPALLALGGIALGVLSCVPDDRYDIRTDEIDLDVTVFEDGITVPINEKFTVSLSEIMDKAGDELSDYIKTAEDGTMILSYEGSAQLDNLTDDLDLSSVSSLAGFHADVNFTHQLSDLLDPSIIEHLPSSGTVHLNSDLVININQKANLKIEGISSEVVEIKELLLDNVMVEMSETFQGLPADAVSTDLTFTLPPFFEPNVITLKGKAVGGKISSEPVQLVKIAGVVPEDGAIIREVGVSGTVTVGSSNLDIATVRDGFNANLKVSIANSQGEIKISKATVVLAYDFEESTTVNLGFPEEFRDVEFDFYDPGVTLGIQTNLGIPMTADIDLVPVIAGVEGTPVSLKNVSLPYSASASRTESVLLYLGKYEASKPAGAEYHQADIGSLLKHLPDELKIVFKAHVLSSDTVIEADADYAVDVNYNLTMPLELGSDLEYVPDIEPIDLSSASSYMSGAAFTLSGKYLNTSPLGLEVTMEILDADKKLVPQEAGSGVFAIGAASSGEFSLQLSPTVSDKAIAWLKPVIKIVIKGKQPLKKTDYIELSDLAITVAGISVSPEELQ